VRCVNQNKMDETKTYTVTINYEISYKHYVLFLLV